MRNQSTMQQAIIGAALILFACSASIALAADSPEFEVASVKRSAPPSLGSGMRAGSRGGPGTSDPGQVTYNNVTLKNLLMTAYGVKIYQISGPGWLDTERYDIVAKMPPGATKEQFALMLQNLLASRFKMTLHHETKNLPLYELVVAKNGPKLKQSVDDPNAPPPPPPGTMPAMGKDGVPRVPPGGAMMTGMNGSFRMGANKQSMSKLAEMLTNQVGSPVVDKTGLTGEYDYTLEFSPEGLPGGGMPAGLGLVGPPPPGAGGPPAANAAGDPNAPSLFTALQQQLGLKLEQKKGPLDLLVIDRAEKAPTEN